MPHHTVENMVPPTKKYFPVCKGSLGLAVGGLLLCGRLDARLLSQRLFFLRLCAVLIRVLCALAIFRSSVALLRLHHHPPEARGDCPEIGRDRPRWRLPLLRLDHHPPRECRSHAPQQMRRLEALLEALKAHG